MESKSHALAAGVFVIAAAALLAGLAMWLLRDVANTTVYEMVTDQAVTGLQPEAAVRFKGVAAGKVTSISFAPDSRSSVLVRIAVSPDAPITQSTFATLAFQGVTGLSFVQLSDPGDSSAPPAPGPSGGPPRIPLKDNALGLLTDRAADLMEKVERTVDNLNSALGSENQAALTATLKESVAAAKALNQLAVNTDKTIQNQLGPDRADLPALVRQTTQTMTALQGVSAKANTALDNAAAATADLRRGMNTLTAEGGAINRLNDSVTTFNAVTLPHVQGVAEDASRAMRRLDHVVESIGENPQSLLYGDGPIPPGPGEPGFAASAPLR
jgi:phospholipid/cholesterol/gamma-HCH transport system substrate-binding protein